MMPRSWTLLLCRHPQNGGTMVQRRDFPKARSLSFHLSSASSDKTRLWMGGWPAGPVTDVDLSCWFPKIQYISSGRPEDTRPRGPSLLTLPESNHRIHFCHGTPAPETNHSHTCTSSMSFWLQSSLVPVVPYGLLMHTYMIQTSSGHEFRGPGWTCNSCSPVVVCHTVGYHAHQHLMHT